MNWYDEIIQSNQQQQQEKIADSDNWYDKILAENSNAEPVSNLPTRLAREAGAGVESAAHLIGHSGLWLAGEGGGLAQTLLDKMHNSLVESALRNRAIEQTKDTRGFFDVSKLKIDEEELKRLTYTPQETRARADFVREAIPMIMPEPFFPETQRNLEVAGKTLDKLIFWKEPIDKFISEKGHPEWASIVNFFVDLAAFKGVHKIGSTAYSKVRSLAKQAEEGKITGKSLDSMLDDLGISEFDLKTPEGRQAYIESLTGKEPATQFQQMRTPEGRQTVIDREWTKHEGQAGVVEPVVEEPRGIVSGAKTERESNLESRQHMEAVNELRKNIQTDNLQSGVPEAAGRIQEAAEQAKRSRETALAEAEIIPPEVSGFDRPVYITKDGKVVNEYGGEVKLEDFQKKKSIEEPVKELVPTEESVKSIEKTSEPKVEEPTLEEPYVAPTEFKPVKANKEGKTVVDLDTMPEWVETGLEELLELGTERQKLFAEQLLTEGELDTPGLVKSFNNWAKKLADEVKPELEEIQVPDNITRVDPETGRPPGGHEAPVKQVDLGTSEVLAEIAASKKPLTSPEGKVLKSKYLATKRMEELGKIGKLVKDPDSDGWLVKQTPKQRKATSKQQQKMWEEILKEENTEIERSFKSEGVQDLFDIISNERGELNISPEAIKKLKDKILQKEIEPEELIKNLVKRGASMEQLKEFSSGALESARQLGTSKWLQKGDDPSELLPRRRKSNGREAPAVSRSEANTVALAKNLKQPVAGAQFSLETPIRTFDKLGKDVKDTFYWPMKDAEHFATKELDGLRKDLRKMSRGVSIKTRERIMSYAIGAQKDGLAVLEAQGIKHVKELTPREMKIYETLREKYEGFYERYNEARKAAGETPFPKVENYFTWLNDFTWLKQERNIGLFEDYRTIDGILNAQKKTTPSSQFSKSRAGEEHTRKLILDPFKVFDTYANEAVNYIHKAPLLAKFQELLGDKFGLQRNAPNTYNFLQQWRDFQAYNEPAWGVAQTKWLKRAQKMNSLVAYGLLSWNVRSALIQPSSLIGTFALTGHHTLTGLVKAASSPSAYKMAWEKSKVLNTRMSGGGWLEIPEVTVKGKAMKVAKQVGDVGLAPLGILDHYSATATWLAAFEHAKTIKSFKTELDRIRYADDIVIKSQASAARADMTAFQRTNVGRIIGSLQTFVINQWDLITKDVMGIGNADINNPQVFARVSRFVLGTTLINAFYEDVLGFNSPLGTPLKSFRETYEENANKPEAEKLSKATWAATSELAEFIPLVGGAIRYDSSIGGPLVGQFFKLAHAANKGQFDARAAMTLTGIPAQLHKSWVAYERAGNELDIALGRYVKPKKKTSKGISGVKGF